MIPPEAGHVAEAPAWEARRLWSLWEMLNLVLGAFYIHIRALNHFQERALEFARTNNSAEFYKSSEALPDLLNGLLEECQEIGLPESEECARRIARRFEARADVTEIGHRLKALLELIESEGGKRATYNIRRDKGDLYDPMFDRWEKIADRFGSVVSDARDAILAYAVDLNDACIFHLMRITEIGLRALARERRVKLPRKQALEWADWHTVIEGINSEVKKIAGRRRGAAREAALEFYRGALGEFEAFKDVYRNNIMHTRKHYDEHRALQVLNHVTGFMERLSERLDENARKQISWGIR